MNLKIQRIASLKYARFKILLRLEKLMSQGSIPFGGKCAWSPTNESLPVYASALILQIYNIFATASKCRENNGHSAQCLIPIGVPIPVSAFILFQW